MGIRVLKCDVCGEGVEFNADAQVTADTILCRECILRSLEGMDEIQSAGDRYCADIYNRHSEGSTMHYRVTGGRDAY
jgi:hypothetical protein